MLNRLNQLIGMTVWTADDDLGNVTDVLFDDLRWAARYLVVHTGGWLKGVTVLISPHAIGHIDWQKRRVQVNLSRKQVESSPPIDDDLPVSRQHEEDYFGYYGYPYYWSGPLLWGPNPYPIGSNATLAYANGAPRGSEAPSGDAHLRSAKQVSGYHIEPDNDSIGHVEDFLFDHQSWAIRYVVVATRNWWPGKQVIIPPKWIASIDWAEHSVNVDVSRELIQSAPEFLPHSELSREQEASLHRHYHRPGYWEQTAVDLREHRSQRI